MTRPHNAKNSASLLVKTLLPVALIALLLLVAACSSPTPNSPSTPDNVGTQTGGEDADGATTDGPTVTVDREARDAFLDEFFTEDEYSSEESAGDEEDEEIPLVTYQVDGDEISDPVEESVASDLVDPGGDLGVLRQLHAG
jgi:hypothetical protein